VSYASCKGGRRRRRREREREKKDDSNEMK